MTIINQTRWNTAHLRAFISRVAHDELPAAGRKRLHVTVRYTRIRLPPIVSRPATTARGYAYYGTPEHPGAVTIALPRPEDAPLGLEKVYFVTLLAHELAHSRGAKHALINKSAIYDPRLPEANRTYHTWADSLPLEPAAPQPPKKAIPRTVTIDRKLEACRAKVAEYQTKIKRNQTFLRKWQRKLRYYERALTLAAAPLLELPREEAENEVPKL